MPLYRGSRRLVMCRRVSSVDPSTTAWVNAVVSAGGSVSAPRRAIVDTFIKALKAGSPSLFSTMDRYWLLAGEDAGSAKVDMVNLQSLTVVGTVVLDTTGPDRGYTSIDSSNYVDTGYIPSSSALNYLLNSATFGGQVQSNRTLGATVSEFGAANGAFTNVSTVNGLTLGGNSDIVINAGAGDGNVSSTARGSWIASRTGVNAGQLYYNGSSSLPGISVTKTSTGLPDVSFVIGGFNIGGTPSNFSGDQVSSFFAASGWNGTQAAAFEAAQNAMMTSIGINVH